MTPQPDHFVLPHLLTRLPGNGDEAEHQEDCGSKRDPTQVHGASVNLCSPSCRTCRDSSRARRARCCFTFQMYLSQCCSTGFNPSSELSGLIVPLRPSDSAGSVLPVSRAAGRARFLTPPACVINPGRGGSGLPGECVFLPSHVRGMSVWNQISSMSDFLTWTHQLVPVGVTSPHIRPPAGATLLCLSLTFFFPPFPPSPSAVY